jgi:hypothetical protein
MTGSPSCTVLTQAPSPQRCSGAAPPGAPPGGPPFQSALEDQQARTAVAEGHQDSEPSRLATADRGSAEPSAVSSGHGTVRSATHRGAQSGASPAITAGAVATHASSHTATQSTSEEGGGQPPRSDGQTSANGEAQNRPGGQNGPEGQNGPGGQNGPRGQNGALGAQIGQLAPGALTPGSPTAAAGAPGAANTTTGAPTAVVSGSGNAAVAAASSDEAPPASAPVLASASQPAGDPSAASSLDAETSSLGTGLPGAPGAGPVAANSPPGPGSPTAGPAAARLPVTGSSTPGGPTAGTLAAAGPTGQSTSDLSAGATSTSTTAVSDAAKGSPTSQSPATAQAGSSNAAARPAGATSPLDAAAARLNPPPNVASGAPNTPFAGTGLAASTGPAAPIAAADTAKHATGADATVGTGIAATDAAPTLPAGPASAIADLTVPGQTSTPPQDPQAPILGYGVGLQQAIETVQATIELAARQGLSQARIALAPAELGEIRIHLTQTSAGLLARVTAATPAAAQTLAEGQGELRQSLHSLGLIELRLDIGSFADPDARDREGSSPGSARETPGAAGRPIGAHDIDDPNAGAVAQSAPAGAPLARESLIDVLA